MASALATTGLEAIAQGLVDIDVLISDPYQVIDFKFDLLVAAASLLIATVVTMPGATLGDIAAALIGWILGFFLTLGAVLFAAIGTSLDWETDTITWLDVLIPDIISGVVLTLVVRATHRIGTGA